ncbi:MAG: SDR family oxidoreductase [Alphaproteobacteria bacterium]|nr:MAG: SDR family oxidoreductase [Alphaproteobacteria bacterium]
MMSSKRLHNKVILVFGGLGLLGKTLCKAIRTVNGTPVIADVSHDAYRDWLAKEGLSDTDFPFVPADILETISVDKALRTVHETFGRLDAVLNAAYPRNKNYGVKFLDVSLADFNENVSLLLGGYFNVMQRAAKFFLDNEAGGNIVNISSIYGVIPPRFEIYKGTSMTTPVEYAAAKSALQHVSRYAAKYLKGSNIRINCVSPGGLLDNQPAPFLSAYGEHCNSKGMLTPDDVVGTILFLLSDDSAYVTGQNIVVDDGFTL